MKNILVEILVNGGGSLQLHSGSWAEIELWNSSSRCGD